MFKLPRHWPAAQVNTKEKTRRTLSSESLTEILKESSKNSRRILAEGIWTLCKRVASTCWPKVDFRSRTPEPGNEPETSNPRLGNKSIKKFTSKGGWMTHPSESFNQVIKMFLKTSINGSVKATARWGMMRRRRHLLNASLCRPLLLLLLLLHHLLLFWLQQLKYKKRPAGRRKRQLVPPLVGQRCSSLQQRLGFFGDSPRDSFTWYYAVFHASSCAPPLQHVSHSRWLQFTI